MPPLGKKSIFIIPRTIMPLRRQTVRSRLLPGLGVVLWLGIFGPVFAQTYVEPSSSTGGVTATPLNGSDTTQRKLGTLIIGADGGASQLCLNTSPDPNGNGQPLAGDSNCITGWNQISGHNVRLFTDSNTGFGGNPGSLPFDSGYIRLKAQDAAGGQPQPFTAIFEGSTVTGSTALWAAAQNSDGYAAYFQGMTAIMPDLASNAGKLCLNGTMTLDGTSAGKGCITSWSQITGIVPPPGNYVNLQSMDEPSLVAVQSGGAALSGSANLAVSTGGVVVGAPTAATPCVNQGAQCVPLSCGDGICSSSSGETSTNCLSDCPTRYTLTVKLLGATSAGIISDDASSIFCQPGCSATFSSGQVVTLSLESIQSGYHMTWGGVCAGYGTDSCPVTMTSDQTVTATFTLNGP